MLALGARHVMVMDGNCHFTTSLAFRGQTGLGIIRLVSSGIRRVRSSCSQVLQWRFGLTSQSQRNGWSESLTLMPPPMRRYHVAFGCYFNDSIQSRSENRLLGVRR